VVFPTFPFDLIIVFYPFFGFSTAPVGVTLPLFGFSALALVGATVPLFGWLCALVGLGAAGACLGVAGAAVLGAGAGISNVFVMFTFYVVFGY
jgi:hypothetical protein